MKEIQLDDLDLDRIKMWRKAALKNPIIGEVLEVEKSTGKVLKKHIRLKSLSKGLQRKIRPFLG